MHALIYEKFSKLIGFQRQINKNFSDHQIRKNFFIRFLISIILKFIKNSALMLHQQFGDSLIRTFLFCTDPKSRVNRKKYTQGMFILEGKRPKIRANLTKSTK